MKNSYLWKNTKENRKTVRKNSISILALNSNKATHCWGTDWRMTDCHPASLLCLSQGWEGVVLHEHPPAEHTLWELWGHCRDDWPWKVLSIVRPYLSSELKAMIPPSSCDYLCAWGCWQKQPRFVRESHLWWVWIFLSIQSHREKEAFVLLDDKKGCVASLILLTSIFWRPGHS